MLALNSNKHARCNGLNLNDSEAKQGVRLLTLTKVWRNVDVKLSAAFLSGVLSGTLDFPPKEEHP